LRRWPLWERSDGAQGAQGAGLTGFQIVTQNVTSTVGVATLTITCPPNNIAISAGFPIAGGNQVRVTQMQPVGSPTNQWIFEQKVKVINSLHCPVLLFVHKSYN
jgi:hypothetical protein